MWQNLKATFTTKQNNILLIALLAGIFIQACQKNSHEHSSQELLAGFRLSIQERFQQGDTLPHPWETLQKALPKNIDGFEFQKVNGGTFSPNQNKFSAVSQFFTNREGKYVFIKLSDYAADSSAFNFWMNRRIPQTKFWPGESETLIIEDKKEAVVHRSSAIHGSRYQIDLATNHPEGPKFLHDVLGKLAWEKLE